MFGIHLKTALPVVLLGVLWLDFAESSFYNVNNKEKEQDLHDTGTGISEHLLRGGHAVEFPSFGNEELAVEYQNNRRLDEEVLPNSVCMEVAAGFDSVCTANDVRVSKAYNGNDIRNCVSGQNVNLTLVAELICNAKQRYDIGIFVAEDQADPLVPDDNAANTGSTCTRTFLAQAVDGTECNNTKVNNGELNVSGSEVLSFADGGPFYNAECGDTPDVCGDLLQDVPTIHVFNVTVPCVSDVIGGNLKINVCLSWDNVKSDGSTQKPSCTNVNQTAPNTKSKCRCEDVEIGNVVVCDVTANFTSQQSCSVDGSSQYILTPLVNISDPSADLNCTWTFSPHGDVDNKIYHADNCSEAVNVRNITFDGKSLANGNYSVNLLAIETNDGITCSDSYTTDIVLAKILAPDPTIVLNCEGSYAKQTDSVDNDVNITHDYIESPIPGSGFYTVNATKTFTHIVTECSVNKSVNAVVYDKMTVEGNLTGSCDNTFTFDSTVTGGKDDSLAYSWTFTFTTTTDGYTNTSNETNGNFTLPMSATGTNVTALLVVTTDIGGKTCSGNETLYKMVYSPIQVTLVKPANETCSSTLDVQAAITGGSGNYALTGTSNSTGPNLFTCHDMNETCTFDMQDICETVTGTVSITDTGTETGTECPSKNDSITVTKATTIFPS